MKRSNSSEDVIVQQLVQILHTMFGPRFKELRGTTHEFDCQRYIIELREPKNLGQDCYKYPDFGKAMTAARMENAHSASFNKALATIDEEAEHKISGCTSPMWRFTWYKQEADKLMDLWSWILRALKRTNKPRHDLIIEWRAEWPLYHREANKRSGDAVEDGAFPSFPSDSDAETAEDEDDENEGGGGCEKGKGIHVSETLSSTAVEPMESSKPSSSAAVEPISVDSSGDEQPVKPAKNLRRRSKTPLNAPSAQGTPRSEEPKALASNIMGVIERVNSSYEQDGAFDHAGHKQTDRADAKRSKAERAIKSAASTLRRNKQMAMALGVLPGGEVPKKARKLASKQRLQTVAHVGRMAAQKAAKIQGKDDSEPTSANCGAANVRKRPAGACVEPGEAEQSFIESKKKEWNIMMPDGDCPVDPENVKVKSWTERTKTHLKGVFHGQQKVVVISVGAYGGENSAEDLIQTFAELYKKGWTKEQIKAYQAQVKFPDRKP